MTLVVPSYRYTVPRARMMRLPSALRQRAKTCGQRMICTSLSSSSMVTNTVPSLPRGCWGATGQPAARAAECLLSFQSMVGMHRLSSADWRGHHDQACKQQPPPGRGLSNPLGQSYARRVDSRRWTWPNPSDGPGAWDVVSSFVLAIPDAIIAGSPPRISCQSTRNSTYDTYVTLAGGTSVNPSSAAASSTSTIESQRSAPVIAALVLL